MSTLTGSRTTTPKDWLALVGFGVLSYGVAALGSVATVSNVQGWYATAAKPPFNPPDWLFGPVWTVLYGLIAVSAWLVWLRRDDQPGPVRGAMVVWGVQLALNLAWTPAFFAARWLWPAFGIILLLDAAVVVTMLRFRAIRPVAAWMLAPYLAWILFASLLNVSLAILN